MALAVFLEEPQPRYSLASTRTRTGTRSGRAGERRDQTGVGVADRDGVRLMGLVSLKGVAECDCTSTRTRTIRIVNNMNNSVYASTTTMNCTAQMSW